MLGTTIHKEIERLSQEHGINSSILEQFAAFVLQQGKPSQRRRKPKGPQPLKMAEVKKAVFDYFKVKNTKALRQSSEFKLATDGLDGLNLQKKDSWEVLYRQFVGVLPHEQGEEGADCINGINIFKYFRPWQVFGLDSKTATEAEIKSAYRELSKKYHPDNPEMGNPKIFDRINTMYKAIHPQAFQV